MSKKPILLLSMFVLLFSGCASTQNDTSDNLLEVADDGLSLSNYSAHDSEDDCWLVIDNAVYDVTSYIPSHPAGNSILQGCGKDATDIFASKHSDDAYNELMNYYIGDLN